MQFRRHFREKCDDHVKPKFKKSPYFETHPTKVERSMPAAAATQAETDRQGQQRVRTEMWSSQKSQREPWSMVKLSIERDAGKTLQLALTVVQLHVCPSEAARIFFFAPSCQLCMLFTVQGTRRKTACSGALVAHPTVSSLYRTGKPWRTEFRSSTIGRRRVLPLMVGLLFRCGCS